MSTPDPTTNPVKAPLGFVPKAPGPNGYETLLVVKEGPIDWLTLNRPKVLNAMSETMMLELQHYFVSLRMDRTVRVVILTGAGRAFCAGRDLKGVDMNDTSPDADMLPLNFMFFQGRVSEVIKAMRRAAPPIISLINGFASGGGMSMALASDIRIAATDMKMNGAFIKLGFGGGDAGSSYFLSRLVGSSVASELLLTGRFIDAARSLSLGLVSQVVEPDKLLEAGRALANEIIACSPGGIRLTKELLNYTVDMGSLDAVLAFEDRNQDITAQSLDLKEGIQAFIEKRKSQFKDR
jgi:enoyl-CoA hydratase